MQTAIANRQPIQTTTEQTIIVGTLYLSQRNVYGNSMLYPACETSSLFARLLNVKTFNRAQIDGIKALGYRVLAAPLPAVDL